MVHIARFLSETHLKSEGDDIVSAIVPLLKLLTLTMTGLLLARFKMIPRATFKLLSKLVFALFLPCLIFNSLGTSITLKNFIQWWYIPVNVVISTICGCLLGYLVVLICRPPPEFNRFTIIMIGFGNTGNLPLAIVSSVCHSSEHPFGPDCRQKGTAYVSFAQWVAVILVYTLVYHMMEPPMEYYEIVQEEGEIQEEEHNEEFSTPLLVEAEWPGIEDKETERCKTPFIARVFGSLSSLSSLPDINLRDGPIARGNTPSSVRCFAEPRVVRKIRVVAEKTPIQHVLQPPTLASLLAIIVGVVPHFKAFIFGMDAPLAFITDSLDILAGATIPAVMLILGGMLSEGPNESTLGLRTTIGVIVARLLVLPLLGIGILGIADKLNILLEGDRMFLFVLFWYYSTPSAILLGAIASLRGYGVKEASALLFWQHILALASLSLYIVVYFKLLSFI